MSRYRNRGAYEADLGSVAKDVRAVMQQARDQGCSIVHTGSNHYKVTTPNGTIIVSGTPRDPKIEALRLRTRLARRGVEA